MASELIFAAAYPARVAIPIDSASVRHRNGQFGLRLFDRRKRSGFDRDWKHDHNPDEQCKRENFFHSVFQMSFSQIIQPRDCVVQNAIRACATVDASLLEYSAPRMEGSALHERDRIKNESPQTFRAPRQHLRAVISCI
jgi:hypothetical protein